MVEQEGAHTGGMASGGLVATDMEPMGADQCRLASPLKRSQLLPMSAVEIIEQIKALPAAERAQVARYIVQQDDSWIPDEFQQAMADAGAERSGGQGSGLAALASLAEPMGRLTNADIDRAVYGE